MRVLRSYERSDAAEALEVWREDLEVDSLNNSLFRETLTYTMENPRNITFCTHLLFCAKNIERIGDHATNIAETVYFIVEGRMPPDERPKADLTGIGARPLPSCGVEIRRRSGAAAAGERSHGGEPAPQSDLGGRASGHLLKIAVELSPQMLYVYRAARRWGARRR